MGVFDKIKEAIWGKEVETVPVRTASAVAPATASQARSSAVPSSVSPAKPSVVAKAPEAGVPASSPAPSQAPSSDENLSKNPPTQVVDVGAILDAAVKRNGQKLEWRRSIVDLMKALDLDSSLANRKELAQELNYAGDTNDSATMNVWLHKALMKKLAENGGRVPADLSD
jgi:hypothetical protein